MSIHQIDATNGLIPGFVTAFQQAGVITSILYESATALVFTSPYTGKVLYLSNKGGLTCGDAWISSTSLTNPVVLLKGYTLSGTAGVVISTTNSFTYGSAYSTSAITSATISKFVNGDNFCIGQYSAAGSTYSGYFYNMTKNEYLKPDIISRMLTPTGFYYDYSPLLRLGDTYVYRDYQFIPEIRFITRSNFGLTPFYEISGNDVLYSMCYIISFSNELQYLDCTMILKGGNL